MRLLPTCQEVHAHFIDLDEGVLPFHQRWAYRLHLLLCKACQAAYHGLKALPVLAKSLLAEPEPLPPEHADRILARLAKRLGEEGSTLTDGRPPR